MRRAAGLLAALVLAALAAGTVPTEAAVGEWTSYTSLFHVREIEAVPGGIMVATGGGIRRIAIPSRKEIVHRNTEGLVDVSIQALAPAPDGGMWASSELGYLYHLPAGASRWTLHGTSYKASGWRMNRRALLYREGYLVAGTVKGLTFFDTRRMVADANITKMGSATGVSVNSVLMEGDTLWAGTDKGLFRATLHLDRLLKDKEINVFNPAIWTLVATADSAADTTLETGSAEAEKNCARGLLYRREGGIRSGCSGSAVPERGGLLITGVTVEAEGKAWPDSFGMEALAYAEGQWFIGGVSGLFRYVPSINGMEYLHNPEDLPRARVTMVNAGRAGVHLYAAPNVFRRSEGIWNPVVDLWAHSDAVDAEKRGSDPLHVSAEGDVFLGSWGRGLYAFQNSTMRHFDVAAGGSCLESAIESGANYSVVWSMAPFRSSGVFIGSLRYGKPFSLSYYDFAGKRMECLQAASASESPKALEVVGDSVLVVVTGRGLEAFRIREAGGRVSLDAQDLLSPQTNAPEPALDARMDHSGNLWVTSEGGKIFYVPEIRFGSGKTQAFRELEGFPGTECRNIERDGRGHVWVGCIQGGLVEIIPGRDSLSHAFRRYRLEDGLLSETVLHLDVDEERGDVWIVTEKGVNRFQSASRPLARSLSSAKVYPNPFRDRHGFVLFDGLSAGSKVEVLTQGGSVVYQAALGSDDGGQLRWDGRNAAGRRVTEGVYFYVIRSSKDVKRGKLIVAR
jgi:ligand-binding sensor domain-containing protein